MSLDLTDLIKLAVLTKLAEGTTTLLELLGASEMWHELKGRPDLRTQLSMVMRDMTTNDLITVVEQHKEGAETLTGVDAQMAIERSVNGLKPSANDNPVLISITALGEQTYRTLANGYYNG